MDRKRPHKPVLELMKEAYPNLSDEQQEEARERLKRYLEICMRIYEAEQQKKREDNGGDRV